MNWAQAALAAAAGAACAGFIYASFNVVSRIPVFGEGPSITWYASPQTGRFLLVLVQVLLSYLSYLVAFGAGSTLPAKVLGAGWLRSFLSGVSAYIAALALALMIVGLLNRLILSSLSAAPLQSDEFVALIFVLGTALTLVFAVRAFSLPLVVATVMVAAVALPLAPIFGEYVGLIAWIILPAVAALSQSSNGG